MELKPAVIPKTIHISWLDSSIFYHQSPMITNGVSNLVKLNPGWKVLLYLEDDVNRYLREELGLHVWRLLSNTHVVERLDVWRLIKLYNEGGVYVDIDRLCNVPMDEIIEPDVQCILPTGGDFDFSHDLMISAPQNPFYLRALNLTIDRRRAGQTSVYSLGPQTYMHAISLQLTGKMVDSNPGLEEINKLRDVINNIPFLRTFREEVPYNTLLFRKDRQLIDFDHETEKRKFYASYGIKHWTSEW